MTAALVLALMSSLAYGAADFLGGGAARGAHVLRVVLVAAPASLAVELLLWPVIGASFSTAAVVWGTASGVASAAAFALLYRALAIGPMSVLSPVTALVAATLPVIVGLLSGEQLSALATTGIVLALVAVVLVSGGGGDIAGARPSRAALTIALGAGAAVALRLVCFDQAPDDSDARRSSSDASSPPSRREPSGFSPSADPGRRNNRRHGAPAFHARASANRLALRARRPLRR